MAKVINEFDRYRELTGDIDKKIHRVSYCKICKRFRSLNRNNVCAPCVYNADRTKRGLENIALYTT